MKFTVFNSKGEVCSHKHKKLSSALKCMEKKIKANWREIGIMPIRTKEVNEWK